MYPDLSEALNMLSFGHVSSAFFPSGLLLAYHWLRCTHLARCGIDDRRYKTSQPRSTTSSSYVLTVGVFSEQRASASRMSCFSGPYVSKRQTPPTNHSTNCGRRRCFFVKYIMLSPKLQLVDSTFCVTSMRRLLRRLVGSRK